MSSSSTLIYANVWGNGVQWKGFCEWKLNECRWEGSRVAERRKL
jgi:hypothetical protein